jgi:4-amino-4-deoxy-L-arabinose transferase-like glycosyltransferase
MNIEQRPFYGIIQSSYFRDIRFWIFLFFVIRLVGITNPPLEIGHNWRQTFTNSVARTFYDSGNSIFFPEADIYGNKPGIVGTEFPFLNYLICIFAKLFGYAHWYGRLINLIVSSFGVFYFYKLVKKFFKPEIAFNATLILICSIWFAFSRKSMPDTFSISLIMIGIYYGFNYFTTLKIKDLLLFLVFVLIGILCKIPGMFLLSFFILPFLDKNIRLKNKIFFAFALITVLYVVSFWYFMWVPYLDSLFGNRLFFPRSLPQGMHELLHLWQLTAEKFYFSSLESFIAFAFFIAGCFFIIRKKDKIMMMIVIPATVIFMFFMIKTGEVFPLHSYYVIPFTPLMAMITAYGLNEVPKVNYRIVLLSLIMIEGIANQNNDFFIKKSEMYKLELESVADKISSRADAIAINGGENPQQLYFTHRKGWRITNEEAGDSKFLDFIKKDGCKFLFLNKQEMGNGKPGLELKKVYEDEYFAVYAFQ